MERNRRQQLFLTTISDPKSKKVKLTEFCDHSETLGKLKEEEIVGQGPNSGLDLERAATRRTTFHQSGSVCYGTLRSLRNFCTSVS